MVGPGLGAPGAAARGAPGAARRGPDGQGMSAARLWTRRSFLGLAAGGGAACLGTPLYMRWVEPRWLRLRREVIRLPRAGFGSSLRLLHLSDLHLSEVVPLDFIRRAIRMGLAGAPDLVCITGDFITHELRQRAAYAEVLRELSQRAPTYACLGNHDGGRWAGHRGASLDSVAMQAFLAEAGIVCLLNQAARVRVAGQDVVLVGLGDLWAGELDPVQAFGAAPDGGTPRLILCHNPDAKAQLEAYRWDVLLCGHTHGGQLRLPLLGTPFAPVQDQRHVSGLYRWSGRWLYVSAGVGNLHGLRLNCPPEVALLTLCGDPGAAAGVS